MLDDLAPRFNGASDVLARLEGKETKSALAAEFELALLWGISQVADLKIATVLPNGKKPDAFSEHLFASGPAAIEITALSDDTFSGQADMDRAANMLVQFAETARKGVAKHLHFDFQEKFVSETGRLRRVRRIAPNFTLTPELESKFREWLVAPDWPASTRIRLSNDQIDVVVCWKKIVHRLIRAFSSVPALAYDLEDNHLFKALRKKEKRQLSSAPPDALKCIFLGDAGCEILRHLRSTGVTETSGDQIIRHFLDVSSIDVICVFSPQATPHAHAHSSFHRSWTMSIYGRTQRPVEAQYERLHALANRLPRPNLGGSQARALHRQGAFRPQARGQYLGTRVNSGPFSMTISVSSRLVHELLAGRCSQEQFVQFAFGKDRNLFELQLARGFMIKNVHLEEGGIDDDDDRMIFELAPDSAITPLTTKRAPSNDGREGG